MRLRQSSAVILWRLYGVSSRALKRRSCSLAETASQNLTTIAPEADWMRAYGEISDFEQQLVENRVVLVKYWLAISKEEQLRRFKERESVAHKKFKITAEDWRNRKKWQAYEDAVCDMVERTSARGRSWTLVEANNKYYARIKVLKTLCDALEKALG